jgi:hypothetical protein
MTQMSNVERIADNRKFAAKLNRWILFLSFALWGLFFGAASFGSTGIGWVMFVLGIGAGISILHLSDMWCQQEQTAEILEAQQEQTSEILAAIQRAARMDDSPPTEFDDRRK